MEILVVLAAMSILGIAVAVWKLSGDVASLYVSYDTARAAANREFSAHKEAIGELEYEWLEQVRKVAALEEAVEPEGAIWSEHGPLTQQLGELRQQIDCATLGLQRLTVQGASWRTLQSDYREHVKACCSARAEHRERIGTLEERVSKAMVDTLDQQSAISWLRAAVLVISHRFTNLGAALADWENESLEEDTEECPATTE